MKARTFSGATSVRGSNFYDADPNLQFEVRHRIEPRDQRRAELWLREVGRVAGNELDRLAGQAEQHPPRLRQYDSQGNRIDVVEYHPAYKAMEEIAFERFALAAMSHRPGLLGWPTPVPHVVKYALSYLFVQAEFGLFCPISMTDSLARVLRRFAGKELRERFLPRLTSTDVRELWQGAMFMTERQAGSDVGATATGARRDESGDWRLNGKKWFCSNADADLILTLARPEGAPAGTKGLGLFLVPRVLEDGRRNRIFIHRLKDKLGSRSIATGEVSLEEALAYPVGDLERGFVQMAEMINVSRLSNAMRSAALMRRAYRESLVHARQREAFGRPLIRLPLMRDTLVSMLIELEAATAVVLFAAQTLDAADKGDEESRRLARILIPLSKYAVCLRGRKVAVDAMDVRGGDGYTEEWIHPRLLRDAHLGSIWEGTSHVVALDVLRAMRREAAAEPLLTAIESACPATDGLLAETGKKLQSVVERLRRRITELEGVEVPVAEARARSLADGLYGALATAQLLREAAWMLEDDGSARKLLVARLFMAASLEPREPGDPPPLPDEEQFESLTDWTPLRPEAATLSAARPAAKPGRE